jgi:ELWxxDGT repeat protein
VDRLAPGPERLYFTAGSLAGTRMMCAVDFPTDGYPCGGDRVARLGVLTLASKGPQDFLETIRTWNSVREVPATDVLFGCIPLGLLAHRSSNFAIVGENMYLTGYSPETGYELCVTDGTVDGSRVVADLYPGPASAAPSSFCVQDQYLYFIAEHPREGRVLWEYDTSGESARVLMPLLGNFPTTVRARTAVMSGTTIYFSGPHPMEDDLTNATLGAVELAGSNADTISPITGFDTGEARWPHELMVVGGDLYYVADDGIHGQELWRTRLSDHVSFLVKDILL